MKHTLLALGFALATMPLTFAAQQPAASTSSSNTSNTKQSTTATTKKSHKTKKSKKTAPAATNSSAPATQK